MSAFIDHERYPLDEPSNPRYAAVVTAARRSLATDGTFSLEGLLTPLAIEQAVTELEPLFAGLAFHHHQSHNVYFSAEDSVAPGVDPAELQQHSSHHTLCSDQMAGFVIRRLYEWDPLCAFLADVLQRPALCRMADPLARLNVMRYGAGERLGWHFDRADFSVTLLLRAADAGGVFEYRKDLRSEDDPNFEGVAALLRGEDPQQRTLGLAAGTLNVFQGRRSIHRVTPIRGPTDRVVAVLSFVEQDDVMFSAADRTQFYGRAHALPAAPPEPR